MNIQIATNRDVKSQQGLWIGCIATFAVIFFALQACIEPSGANLLCAALAVVSIIITAIHCLSPRVIRSSPLSTLAVIGLSVCTVGGALLAQTIAWRPLVYNLDLPVQTFLVCTLLSALSIVVHSFYANSRSIVGFRNAFSGKAIGALGAFRPPESFELWLLGAIGLVATWSVGLPATSTAVEFGDASGKFAQALIPFAIGPFAIPLKRYLTSDQRKVGGHEFVAIAAYFAALVIISMARNSRGTFAQAILTIGLGVFLAVLIGRLKLNRKALTTIVCVAPVVLVLLASLSNLATAMVIARASRDTATASALIRETISIAQDPTQVDRRRQLDAILTTGYNEIYIKNPLLARLVQIKFVDLNLRHADGVTESQRQRLQEETGRRLLNIVPTPILQRFGINFDKNNIRYSSGDFYRLMASRGLLGGFTSGSSIADGLTIFGPAFWLFYSVAFMIFFFMLDSLTLRLSDGRVIFSVVAIFNLSIIFTSSIISESVAGLALMFLRYLPQALILTCSLLFLTRLAGTFASNSRR